MMQFNANVVDLANDLSRAILVTMDPQTSQAARMEAYIACEQFKEASPLCAQAGLYLLSGSYTITVKHFGLQLMEHTIKFKWNEISQEEKLFIKENAMKLLAAGVGPAEDINLLHMKDALSRVIVEMIKREWPQQWPTLLAELLQACEKGESQTELVLLIFLRLVEDVALLQTIESNQRRKDIYQALTVNMAEIFQFFLRLIELHANEFQTAKTTGSPKAMAHSRVVQMVLLTLTGFVEWVSIVHIMAGNGRLLHILCILLNDATFQLPAAECLSQITNRKGQLKDRKPLAVLLSKDVIDLIFQAAISRNADQTEQHYNFLKKLVQVLIGLGSQLTTLWGKDEQVFGGEQLTTFLEALITLTRHSSLTITHWACSIWVSLLNHDQLIKDPILLSYIPKLIEILGPKVIKIPYPLQRSAIVSNTTAAYISLDYDSDEEFTKFFSRCRIDILVIFRQATLIAPLVTFGYCEHWLRARIQKSKTETSTKCDIHDPVYIEWEALSCVLDSVMSRILLVAERPSVSTGLYLLEECLRIETNDPLIVSIILSCISVMFVFLSMSSCQITAGNCVAMSGVTLLPRVLEKIFSALIFENSTQPIAVKNLRRHAASLMIRLGIKYPLLLLPVFDQINSTVQNLLRQPELLSNIEKVMLQESLLVISNQFCDYERQSKFISEILTPIQGLWPHFSQSFNSGPDFIRYIGLDKPAVELMDDRLDNRRKIIIGTCTVLSVIKRCSWPDDPDRASRGGFVVGFTESGNPVCRNPASSHIVPLLPSLLSILRIQNELFARESLSIVSSDYKNVFDMIESEKKQLMGIAPVLVDPMDPTHAKPSSLQYRMRIFLSTLFENGYHMLGLLGPAFGRDLYQLPGISNVLISSIFSHIESIPDHRLRTINRVFLKSFIYSCPPAFYELVLMPIFAHFGPIMLNRLTVRWQRITEMYERGELGNDVNDTEEVFEDILNRTLTREYLDVLKVALVGGTITERDSTSGPRDAMDYDDSSMDGASHGMTRATQSALAAEVISDLGARILRNQITCTPVVMTIFSAISWNDSNCSYKAVLLTGPIIRFLATEQLLTPTIASGIIVSVLQGLQIHGQHDTNYAVLVTLGVQLYEIIRPKFPQILDIMCQIPNINVADIQKLDEKLGVGPTKGNKIDKVKKDLFKKITSELVGKNLGQLFRSEVHIANLPPMNIRTRNSSYKSVVDKGDEPGIVNLFSSNS